MAENKAPTTLKEIEAIKSDMLIPRDVYGYLGVSQYRINCQAQKAPEKLGFPVTILGTRVLIPKDAFIAWAKGELHQIHPNNQTLLQKIFDLLSVMADRLLKNAA